MNSLQSLKCHTEYDPWGNVGFACELTDENGLTESKFVSPVVFANMIKANTFAEAVTLRIGQLPAGFIDGTISADGSRQALIKVPGRVRILRYHEESNTYEVPFPDLIFHLSADKDGRVCTKKVWAIDKKGQLYGYPFGNVTVPDGNICFGNIFANTGLKVKSFMDLGIVVEHFFSSITSDDYWRGSRVNNMFSRQMELLKFLQGKETFPEELLERVDSTVADLLARL